jgi:hypothetical protein
MIPSVEYVLSGNPDAAKAVAADALRSRGLTLEPTPLGGWIAELSGEPAGFFGRRRAAASFIVEVTSDESAHAVIRWNAMSPAGLITGKLAGTHPSDALYAEVADALSAAFSGAGILVEERANP